MTKILDFSNGENIPSLIVVSPNYQIANRSVSIELKTAKVPTFMVRAGCQGINITAENVERALFELSGEDLPFVLTRVIVPKGNNPKTNSPKLEAEAGPWLISKDKKAYETDQYEISSIQIKEKRKYFIPNSRGYNSKNVPVHFRGGYALSKKDVDNILSILTKLQEYFQEK